MVHRTTKAGLGAAYQHGFAVALERGYDVIGEMDADGSHQPEQLPRLLQALGGADLVIGSRWVPGGSVVNWPLHRKALSVGGNLYARMAVRHPGTRRDGRVPAVPARRTLEAIDLATVESVGYCFQADLAWRTVAGGAAHCGGADRVRGAGAWRVEDGPPRRRRVATADHRRGV